MVKLPCLHVLCRQRQHLLPRPDSSVQAPLSPECGYLSRPDNCKSVPSPGLYHEDSLSFSTRLLKWNQHHYLMYTQHSTGILRCAGDFSRPGACSSGLNQTVCVMQLVLPAPVCGEDSKSYLDKCHAACAEVGVVHNGTCAESPSAPAPAPGPKPSCDVCPLVRQRHVILMSHTLPACSTSAGWPRASLPATPWRQLFFVIFKWNPTVNVNVFIDFIEKHTDHFQAINGYYYHLNFRGCTPTTAAFPTMRCMRLTQPRCYDHVFSVRPQGKVASKLPHPVMNSGGLHLFPMHCRRTTSRCVAKTARRTATHVQPDALAAQRLHTTGSALSGRFRRPQQTVPAPRCMQKDLH